MTYKCSERNISKRQPAKITQYNMILQYDISDVCQPTGPEIAPVTHRSVLAFLSAATLWIDKSRIE